MGQLSRFSRLNSIRLITLCLILMVVFAKHLTLESSLISSKENLAHLLGSYESGDVQEWGSARLLPYKYRVLFKSLIDGTVLIFGKNVTDDQFYWIFVIWCFAITLACLFAFDYLLCVVGLKEIYQFAGGLLFISSFPVFYAYNYPIITREDTLAYLWVVLGLIFIVKNKPFIVSIISLFAVMTRETTLIIPFCFLITSPLKLTKKAAYLLPPAIALVGLRLILGFEPYDITYGFFRNLKLPIESIFFLFICFGVFWLTGFLGWRLKKSSNQYGSDAAIVKSFPWVAVAVLFTSTAFSILRENRISFIIFPWIYIMSLVWIKYNYKNICKILVNKNLIYPLIFGIIGLTTIFMIFAYYSETIMRYGLFKTITAGFIGSHTNITKILDNYPSILGWIIFAVIHLALTLVITISIFQSRHADRRSQDPGLQRA